MFDVQTECKSLCTFEWLHSPGFIGNIVEHIHQTAKRRGTSVEEEAQMYKLTKEEQKELGIVKRESRM